MTTSGTEGLATALTENFDLVLLDLPLADVAGEHVLRALMTIKPASRVVAMSPGADVSRRVAAFDAGAIDFVARPFSHDELLARVRVRIQGAAPEAARPDTAAEHLPAAMAADRNPAAGLKLATMPPTGSRVPAGPRVRQAEPASVAGQPVPTYDRVHLDSHRRVLVVRGKAISLSQREFVLMSHLLSRRGQVCTRAELLADVWGLEFDPGTNVVDVYVRRLRTKLADNGIETIRNHGYRLAAG